MAEDNGALIDKIRRDPEFRELVHKRTSFAWTLSGLMAAIYFGFILLVAFAPEFLGTPLGGGIMTYGIPIGLFVIFSAFLLTGLYVRRANSEFDALTEKIVQRVK